MIPNHPGSATKVFEIESRLDQIQLALDWIRELGSQHGWPDRWVFGLVLGADEALTNIVSHASEGERSNPIGIPACIRLVCAYSPQDLSLRIEDEGPEFDPTGANTNPLPESVEAASVGGHGIRLMQHYLKSIHYARQGQRNVLTLRAGSA